MTDLWDVFCRVLVVVMYAEAVALSHGAEPTEQSHGERAKKTRRQEANDPQRGKKKKEKKREKKASLSLSL